MKLLSLSHEAWKLIDLVLFLKWLSPKQWHNLELEGKFTTILKSWKTIFEESTKEVKSFRERLEVSEFFLHQSMSNALRAFCDFVMAAFFKAYGK